MKDFIIILREPDGRIDKHPEHEIAEHRKRMGDWFQKHILSSNVSGGSALTLDGKQIRGREAEIVNGIHKVGTEIVGGYILLKAKDLDEAVSIMQTCPVYEFDGYAEVREFLKT